jgi:aryl-alcohol dehydrogenase-like predicted oxidoreductase
MTKRSHTKADSASIPDATSHLSLAASPAGTKRYRERWAERFMPGFFRVSRSGLEVSSVAHGTYLGDCDDATDTLYAEALRQSLTSGVNFIDTAINYRCQRSERVIGRVLQDTIGAGSLRRDEVVLCTKAGYVPLDGTPPASRDEYASYVKREYLDPGVIRMEDLVGGGHCIAPDFLLNQLERSMQNLGVQSIDCFYVHNPEQQLAALAPAELTKRLRAAFALLESSVKSGKIGVYGCATWNGFRLPAGSHGHLSLFELASIARDVGGENHHFRVIQLPINLTMSEAVRVSTQRDSRGRLVNVLDAARELGIDIVASAPLLQGQLTHDLPAQVRELFAGTSDAQRAVAFVRGLPSVLAAAIGMKSPEHVAENLESLATN